MNAKKIIGYGLIAVLIALAFTACDNDNKDTHTHDAGTWVITQQPTCTEDGVKERQCTVDRVVLETGVVPALGHDWNTVKEVISTVSETTDGVKAIKCQRDSSHIKDEEYTDYATGSAGLVFSLNTDDTYGNIYWVYRGTFEGAVVHIPAYHRPTADDDYLPVAVIANFGYSSTDPEAVYIAATLTTVTFAPQNQLRRIEGITFQGCSLTSIIIPSGVTYIGLGTFSNCTSLTSITIPTSVTTIYNNAFASCTSLSNINIPASVTTMGSAVFRDWTNTQTINVPFANAEATPTGWNENWNKQRATTNDPYVDIAATIKYWNGTTWE
jgi:hypothetical protein